MKYNHVEVYGPMGSHRDEKYRKQKKKRNAWVKANRRMRKRSRGR